MTDHILAAVEVFDPHSCPIMPHATDEWTLTDISRSGLGGADGEIVDEFTLTGNGDGDLPAAVESEHIERVFALGDEQIFRIARPAAQGCACQHVERAGCVVQDITGDGNSLVLTFLVEDSETLRTVIANLKETADTVSLQRLIEGCESRNGGAPTVLDRDTLTVRQEEVLTVAYDMGYFEKPRDATAGTVAAELDICTTTFTEHLAAAQRKVLGDLLSG